MEATPPSRLVKERRSSPVYWLGLVLVVAGMIVFPLLYFALTTLVCWWVYFFATRYFWAIWQWSVGGSYGFALLAICSCTPLLVGGMIAWVMVKPLFSRQARRMHPLVLRPEVEPRVYALVAEVCRIVGAPAPRRIDLDCDLNASARFRRGLLSFFGHDLVLTLGLPLIAGLTQRELAGVIAHEFGHFRQGTGMRLVYLIRRINRWFTGVVDEFDGWGEALKGSGNDGWVGIMLGCIRAGVWISRGILWLLMIAGRALSGLLMRQMEYDADCWEMRVAGSAGFESTMLRLATLGYVLRDIRTEMRRAWNRQLQLPDNLPLLVEYRANHLNAEKRARIENKVGFEKTGWLDTHPSAADRIRQARQLAEPGLLAGEGPARALFESFEAVSRLVTLAHYEDDLNVPTAPDFLIPLEALIKEKNAAQAQAQSPATAPKPVAPKQPAIPMMIYDPSRFRKPE